MKHRFFVKSPIEGCSVELEGSEAHHLIHVLRGKPGDRVTLFDGSGDEFQAEIQQTHKKTAMLSVVERRAVSRELPQRLTLGISLPKGDRQKFLVEKMVELGVSELVPLRTERAVAAPTAHVLERLRRQVIEASKQCGRNRLMEIGPSLDWESWLAIDRKQSVRLVANPGAARELSVEHGMECVVSIGPEGGLTDEEIQRANDADWQIVNLGNSVLRIETAAIAACSVAGHLMRQGL